MTSGISRWLLTPVLVGSLGLSGCSTQYARIGADDGSDACHAYRVTLDSTGNYFGESMVQGALIGAVAGALAGLATGRDAKAVAIGAAAGAALGAAGGYWVALQRNNANQAQLVQKMTSDLQNDNQQLDRTQAAFNQLVDCRRQQANQVRADLRSGVIMRGDAENRMSAIRALAQQDLEIARRIDKNLQERGQNYAFANEQINPQPYLVQVASVARSSPDDNGAPSFRLARGQAYYASRVDANWVKVYGPAGQVGYVPTSAVSLDTPSEEPQVQQSGRGPAPRRPRPVVVASAAKPAGSDIVDRDTSTNLAKRNTFEHSIQTASASQATFELSSG